MKVINVQQKTPQWLAYRASHINASEAAIILGISPYSNVNRLYKEKTKGFEQAPNHFMLRGLELEPIALEKFENEIGLNFFPMVGESEENPWMSASFDGVTICRTAIVEIKANGKKNHDLALNGEIPIHFKAQINHQLFVAGLEMCYYYSFDGQDGVILEVKRDQEFIDKMIEKEFEFWNTLQALTN